MQSRFYSFIGGNSGPWRIQEVRPVVGASLDLAPRLDIQNANLTTGPADARWVLRSFTSNQRYTTRPEQNALVEKQPALGRPEATCAALIPITKTPEWWLLTQDERREIFEQRSSHIATGMRYLPAIARRLHHCRDLGEPFDFLTWFEYAPADANAFEDLVGALRCTEEWRYVEREVDIRLIRENAEE
jgi:chlorite dismutase